MAERPERGHLERGLEGLARDTSRRGFLARAGGVLFAATAGGVVSKAVKPGEADAYHFCGHTFTTGSCPHPSGLPRIDARGYPLGPGGEPIDNLGRPINDQGEPVNSDGHVKRDPDGRPLPPAPRTKVCDEVGKRFGFKHLGRRQLVSVLRRDGPKAPGLLLLQPQADQRRRRARGLLLQRPPGVLRHVLPDEGPRVEPARSSRSRWRRS